MNKIQSDIVEILQKKMTNRDVGFFSNLVLYKMAQIATNMGATVTYAGGEKIPTNLYVLNLANSGFSKGKSLKYLEDSIFGEFKNQFNNVVMPNRSNAVIEVKATETASITGKDVSFEEGRLWKTITALPKYIYTFGSGTTPEGLKGLMTALSMRETGSVSIEIDEIGSNISANKEVMDTLLESYDNGRLKNKLKKTESNDEITTQVPTNLCMFGTPSKLFDGGISEDQLMSFLDTGYARRLVFGYVETETDIMDAREKLLLLNDTSVDADADVISTALKLLASTAYYGKEHKLTDDANIMVFEYEEECLKKAAGLKSYQEIEKTEMSHRYFRALKIAGIYAFIAGSTDVTDEMVKDAIELVELSGKAFQKMMTREKNYVRLARYIAEQDTPVTLAELTHDLSGFFKGSETAKRELITLAKSWSAVNDMIIKETMNGDISYFSGEKIESTNLDHMIVSLSTDITTGYANHKAPWDKFHKMCEKDYNFCTHHMKDGYRDSVHAVPGFNMLVLDVDNGVSIKMVQKLLSNNEYIIYTTKRHTEENNRFRIILPMSKVIKLSPDDHKLFYKNVFDTLPFEVDEAPGDIARKWQTYKASTILTNEGELFDPTSYIPNTAKNQAREKRILSFSSDMSKLERYIFANTPGRNNALIKLALAYVDRGDQSDTVVSLISTANAKLAEPLPEAELAQTVYKTIYKKVSERSND